MAVNESAFSVDDLVQGLASSGLSKGDTVFVQVSLPAASGMDADATHEACWRILSSLLEIVGESGTLLVPAFTYSFERREEYDKQLSGAHAGSGCGAVELSEIALRYAGAIRSDDPLFQLSGSDIAHRI